MERRWLRMWISTLRAAIFLSLLVAIPLTVIIWTHPVLAAAVCPRCFGFVRIEQGVFVERSMPPADRAATLKRLNAAEDRVAKFYGTVEYRPRILVCKTDACFQEIGGGSAQVGSIGSFVLLVSPRAENVVLMSHELSQIELVGRIGVIRSFIGAVPAWFNQGVDVLVSDDPYYLAPAGKYHDRCVAEPSGNLPNDMVVWVQQANRDVLLYAVAACRVDRWMIKRGGPVAVNALLRQIADGTAFDKAYGEIAK
ncbi:MAG TPA: hypothetical protein VF117_05180 [Gammaproteobacteria bacterium]